MYFVFSCIPSRSAVARALPFSIDIPPFRHKFCAQCEPSLGWQDCVVDGVSSYVIDTEVVAYDRDTGNLLPFQVNTSLWPSFCRFCLLPRAMVSAVFLRARSRCRVDDAGIFLWCCRLTVTTPHRMAGWRCILT